MKRQKRWMKSVLETSQSDLPTLPWARRKSTAGKWAPALQQRACA